MNHVADEEHRGGGQKDRVNVAPPGRNISVVNDRIDSRDLFLGTREIIIARAHELAHVPFRQQTLRQVFGHRDRGAGKRRAHKRRAGRRDRHS